MSAGKIPIADSTPERGEDKRLNAVFNDLRKNQITFLNEAGKRVIELSTVLLGVLFTVFGLSSTFPPAYLQEPFTAGIAVATLVLFFLALGAGFVTVQPQEYKDYPQNLTAMQEELRKITRFKVFWFRGGSVLFMLGAATLVWLILRIIV